MEVHPNVYCPLCGVILQYILETTPSIGRHPWLAEIRAIYIPNDSDDPSLTGVGILRFRNILAAPLESERSYLDGATLEEISLFHNSGRLWGHGFHNSCWELLCAQLSPVIPRSDILISISTQLCSTPCPESSYFQFGHDYQGAANTRIRYGRPAEIDSSSPFYADPCTISTLS